MRQTIKPIPSKLNLLQRVKEAGLPISEVVDVGVRDKTGELISAFPDKRHHLFEPVTTFFPEIERNYSGIDYVLYPIALSNESKDMYLVHKALHKDGIVTNSQISDTSVRVDGLEIVDCSTLAVRTFSELDIKIEKDFLLKVDVDGQDLNVLKGFGSEIANASMVIVEATFRSFHERLDYLLRNGFQFFDIVDQVYYGPGFYQCDIACIRSDLANSILRPPISNFIADLWCPV